jgi:alkylhydroperoxidase family enzyme
MFIDAVSEDAATGALAEYYQQQRSAWGFLPNYAATFSTRPDVAEAWNALNTAIRNCMDRRRFELATIAAARALHSTYCTAAHSKFMRDVCGDETTLDQLAQDPTGATLSREDRLAYQFAAKVATSSESAPNTMLTSYATSASATATLPTLCSPRPPAPSSLEYWTVLARSSTPRQHRPSPLPCWNR